MASIEGYIQQRAFGVSSDSTSAQIRATREQHLYVNTREGLVDSWIRDGRVFISSNPTFGTPETMSAAGTAYTATAPSLRFTVPSGLCVVPIFVQLAVVTVAAKNDLFGVIVSDTDTFTSGGEACVARNALIESNDAYRTTQVTNLLNSDTAIVETTLTRTRILKQLTRAGTASETDPTWNPEYNILKGDSMVYIKGPASFLVFAVQETTAAEAEWQMAWAELDTNVAWNT